ncbi:hypothetical protein [Streptomyces sp. NPDC026589]|uniref:hypothetical protein n=1 Tax=Streptomyces sp. NPDC026589 TaxID=3155609 RepID=UPI0033D6D48B
MSLQRVNGTARHLYGADVVLVVTNDLFFTHCPPPAQWLHPRLVGPPALSVPVPVPDVSATSRRASEPAGGRTGRSCATPG